VRHQEFLKEIDEKQPKATRLSQKSSGEKKQRSAIKSHDITEISASYKKESPYKKKNSLSIKRAAKQLETKGFEAIL
jgi:hypothetical protein